MPSSRTTAALSLAAASLADAATGPPWDSRGDIPSGCIPPVIKVPKGGRCLFDDQCESEFCSPAYRSCMAQDEDLVEFNSIAEDPVRRAMMWAMGGPAATFNGEPTRDRDGNTWDICGRTGSADAGTGRCKSVNTGGGFEVTLADDGSTLKAFDGSHAECQCDQRFVDLYLANDWTGAFHGGQFRNYCDISDWVYTLSATEASACPSGRAIITDVEECKLAIAYLGLGDSTEDSGGKHGADKFLGCVKNAGNNQVVFNADNSASGFQLSDSEQYVCKAGATNDDTDTKDDSEVTVDEVLKVRVLVETTSGDSETADDTEATVEEVLKVLAQAETANGDSQIANDTEATVEVLKVPAQVETANGDSQIANDTEATVEEVLKVPVQVENANGDSETANDTEATVNEVLKVPVQVETASGDSETADDTEATVKEVLKVPVQAETASGDSETADDTEATVKEVLKVPVQGETISVDNETMDDTDTHIATLVPTVVKVSGEASLSVPTRAEFCDSTQALEAVGKAFAAILNGSGVAEDDVTVACKAARRLSRDRRLAESADIEYVIEMESDDDSAPLAEDSAAVTSVTDILEGTTPQAMSDAVTSAFTSANITMVVSVQGLTPPTVVAEEKPSTTRVADSAPSSSVSGLVAALAAAFGAAVAA